MEKRLQTRSITRKFEYDDVIGDEDNSNGKMGLQVLAGEGASLSNMGWHGDVENQGENDGVEQCTCFSGLDLNSDKESPFVLIHLLQVLAKAKECSGNDGRCSLFANAYKKPSLSAAKKSPPANASFPSSLDKPAYAGAGAGGAGSSSEGSRHELKHALLHFLATESMVGSLRVNGKVNGNANGEVNANANGEVNGNANGEAKVNGVDGDAAHHAPLSAASAASQELPQWLASPAVVEARAAAKDVRADLTPQIGSSFDHAMVVHRGKRGLEEVRPNPYAGPALPESYRKVLDVHSSVRLLDQPEVSVEEEVARLNMRHLQSHEEFGTAKFAKQWQLEARSVDMAVATYVKKRMQTETRGDGSSLGPVQRVMQSWFNDVCDGIKAEQHLCAVLPPFQEFQRQNAGQKLSPSEMGERYRLLRQAIMDMQDVRCSKYGRNVYGPIMLLLPPEKLAVLVMHPVLAAVLAFPRGARFLSIALRVGEAVEAELHVQADASGVMSPSRRKVAAAVKERSPAKVNRLFRMINGPVTWDDKLRVQVGAGLISILLERAKVDVNADGAASWGRRSPDATVTRAPAFEHDNGQSVRRKPESAEYGRVLASSALRAIIDQGHDFASALNPALLPMLVRPLPWTAHGVGGYLRTRIDLMRTHGDGGQLGALKVAGPRLEPVLRALDVLSQTSWLISLPILAVVQRAWKDDMVLAALPPQNDTPMPEWAQAMSGPDRADQRPWADLDTEERDQRLRLARDLRKLKQHNRDLHSLRCDLINKMHVANEMAQYQNGFYFPHNLDFRGRAYPVPPHLNHLGSDLCRGLLRYGHGKPLGERGLFWLKVHLANLFGVNKLSLADRARWTEDRIKRVVLAGRDPLHPDHRQFWLEAEEPWQALATCMELAAALDSPVPEAYVSSLPVHQDGSCNGLQHYAALGRDEIGGAQVNLVPGDKPSDPYTTVCKRVIIKVEEDAANPASPHQAVAKLLTNKVARKVVKQTVMTTVYGVTFIGARDQIKNRLHEAYGDAGSKELTEDQVFEAAGYLARLTLTSVGDIFVGARRTMDWLTASARIVAGTGRAVRWVTPLGLPVVQPYRRGGHVVIKTVLQEVRMSVSEDAPIHKMRQRTAFPPNFVHSLDSTHLMMTAAAFARTGRTFAGVHDSYWTHACDVEDLAKVLREQFVELYSMPVLEDLKRQFEMDYKVSLPPLPPKGNLDLNVVKNSPYFFS